MSKPIVVLADLDESYLITLELKFLKELKNKVELEVITDRQYFEKYFANPRKMDLLVVGEEMYSQELQKHTIGNLYVLAEYMESGGTEDLSVHKIYKYTSIKEIFNELVVDGLNGLLESVTKKETQIIAVYSPIGGVGVTTIAVALSSALAKNHKKTLFLSTENLQNFQFYLSNKGYLSNELYSILKDNSKHPYKELKHYIRNEEFYYVPPLYASLSAIGLGTEIYPRLIEDIKLSKDFDYIVIDMETGFHEEKIGLLSMADKVTVILRQDAFSVHKIESLLRNMEIKDGEKFVFICNKFEKEKANQIVNSSIQSSVNVSEYIEKVDLENTNNVLKLEKFEGLQQLSYIFL